MINIFTKLTLTIFIEYDVKLHHEPTCTNCECLSVTLHDDLGKVSHIMADKTGTLTKNKLSFKGASIGDILYDENEREIINYLKSNLDLLGDDIDNIIE